MRPVTCDNIGGRTKRNAFRFVTHFDKKTKTFICAHTPRTCVIMRKNANSVIHITIHAAILEREVHIELNQLLGRANILVRVVIYSIPSRFSDYDANLVSVYTSRHKFPSNRNWRYSPNVHRIDRVTVVEYWIIHRVCSGRR